MKPVLTPVQSLVLRRCSGGLQVWETQAAYVALLAELKTLGQLGLVTFREGAGYETTPRGDAWLLQWDE